jgi:transposase
MVILRDSRLTRHPSCLTSGVHLIARRISNGTRTEEGSAAYAATLSVFETCRRRGVEPWRYITDLLARARKGLPHVVIPFSA